MSNLSSQMLALLRAIAAMPAETIKPLGGGYWGTDDGLRPTYANVTQTVYALETRGLLARHPNDELLPKHRARRQLTQAGRAILKGEL